MKAQKPAFILIVSFCLLPILFLDAHGASVGHSPKKDESYAAVTLLYGSNSNFVKSAVALGRSLKASGTNIPMILLYTDLKKNQAAQLEAVGWEPRPIPAINNPSQSFVSRFDYIFSKLAIFGLEEFDRVIYLDADCIVTQNIEELLRCNAEICAVLRSAFFNAGVLVTTPSRTLHQEMLATLESTPADYPDNDQGFLNIFFWNPERCPFFDPNEDPSQSELQRCARLPNFYNGDLALYTLRSDRWLFDARTHSENVQPKIVHFTFGALKPWDWWTYTLIEQHWTWWHWFAGNRMFDSWRSAAIQLLMIVGVLPLTLIRPRFRPVDYWTIVIWAVAGFISFFGSIFYSITFFCSPYTDWLVWLEAFLLSIDVFFRSTFTGRNLLVARLGFYSSFIISTALLMFCKNNMLGLHLNFFLRLAVMISVFSTLMCVFVPTRILVEFREQRKTRADKLDS